MITTAIFTFIWTWNDFFTQLIYLNSPSKFTLPLALQLFVDQTSSSSFGPMFAMSVLALVPIGLVLPGVPTAAGRRRRDLGAEGMRPDR